MGETSTDSNQVTDLVQRKLKRPKRFWEITAAIATILSAAVAVWQIPELQFWMKGNAEITFDIDPGTIVERCAHLSGTAPRQEDSTLWLAVATVDGFYLRKVERHEGDEWEVRITVGSIDDTVKSFDVHALYIADDYSELIEGIHGAGADNEGWFMENLPPHEGEVAETTIVRDGFSTSQCV